MMESGARIRNMDEVFIGNMIGREELSYDVYYNGDWKDNKKHGSGILTIKIGIMKYNGGGTYEGNWVNDERDGKGKIGRASCRERVYGLV